MIVWPSRVKTPFSIDEHATLRIAVTSTPRTGNTWLRFLLDGMYGLSHIAVDVPDDVDWERLPERCVLQLHWPAEPELTQKLARYEFKPVTLLRHPLDVLISILHFTSVTQDTSVWAGRRGGDERSIAKSTPVGPEFLEYCCGERARLLLSISPSWMQVAGCCVVSYEDLVQSPESALARLANDLGQPARTAIADVVAANAIDELRAHNVNQHCWQGRPGLWRQFISAGNAQRIAAAHPSAFAAGAYCCDSDAALDENRAERNWQAFEFSTLKRELSLARNTARLNGEAVAVLQGEVEYLRRYCEHLRGQCEQLHEQLEPVRGLGPNTLKAARTLKQAAGRFPRLANALRRFAEDGSRRTGA